MVKFEILDLWHKLYRRSHIPMITLIWVHISFYLKRAGELLLGLHEKISMSAAISGWLLEGHGLLAEAACVYQQDWHLLFPPLINTHRLPCHLCMAIKYAAQL